MDFLQQLKLGTTADMGIILAVVFCLTQALKQTGINNKWMPWLAMLIGTGAGIIAALITKDTDLLSAGIFGMLLGGFTSGLFDGFKGIREEKK
ncbi:holin [Lentilactobacillus sp. Marseille-Q4993]|uniref:holin n=1 Tax=Lentilactobacillus sp. Marseille-Q4993 TaxID=3039492 RepID=UPI0024BC3114|nr:holin [Lentilactobacillus sp. Marseille-Q4993]